MKVENISNQIDYDQIQSKRLVTNGEQQVNILSFEKGSTIPSHTSTKDATIHVLEGKIKFTIGKKDYELNANDIMAFGKDDEHSVLALENSKFLLIQ